MVGRRHEEIVKERSVKLSDLAAMHAGFRIVVVGLALAAGCGRQPGGADPLPAAPGVRAQRSNGSVAKAYVFLRFMMDRYAKGAAIRLVRSFDGGPLRHFTDAVTYDDVLFVDAMLAEGTDDGVSRSKIVGSAFLFVQAHDPAGDGRLRAAYAPRPLRSPQDIKIDDGSSDAGNMAWVGQALVQLYVRTGEARYLRGAAAIAAWLARNAHDTRGSGGYTGGYTARGKKIEWKSTEHNIDIYAFFEMLASRTGERKWDAKARWAERFVASMWDARDGRFYVGTGNDGVTPNKSFRPEDVNSWSYLAFENSHWAAAPSWDVTHLAVGKGGFDGVSFCSGDRSGVWFEGTAHLAGALKLRAARGDRSQAQTYLADIAYAQQNGLNGDGRGIIAASKNGLSDCDGDKYFASPQVGATAWYALASGGFDPFLPLPSP
jgi:hypothetical protein